MSTPLSTAMFRGRMGKIIPWKPKVIEQPPQPIIGDELQQRINSWVKGWKNLPAPASKITHAMIMQVVCDAYSLHKNQILEPRRTQALAIPRHIICYLTRQHTRLAWHTIGRLMHRDHTSIIHGWNMVAARRMTSTSFNDQITHIEQQLQAMVQPDA